MKKFFKFNNSRSTKNPFFVYIKMENGEGIGVDGSGWYNPIGLMKEGIEITEKEFNLVQKSYDDNKPEIGDEVVILEYCSFKLRYSKIVEQNQQFDNLFVLEDGRHFLKKYLRKKEFIHTK
jgi:hypothetical protein